MDDGPDRIGSSRSVRLHQTLPTSLSKCHHRAPGQPESNRQHLLSVCWRLGWPLSASRSRLFAMAGQVFAAYRASQGYLAASGRGRQSRCHRPSCRARRSRTAMHPRQHERATALVVEGCGASERIHSLRASRLKPRVHAMAHTADSEPQTACLVHQKCPLQKTIERRMDWGLAASEFDPG